jgi:hypothetical protein
MMDDLRRKLRELQDYAEDVQRAGFTTFGDALNRMLGVLDRANPLGALVARMLPTADFDEWYQSQVTQAVNRGSLSWPPSNDVRIGLQLELLRRVDDGRLDLWNFCHMFLTTETKYDDMVHSLSSHVIRPFVRDLIRLLHAQPEMREDEVGPVSPRAHSRVFVDEGQIAELKSISIDGHTARKLVRLCEELNVCYSNECFFSVAMLVRAILDYVPPFFRFRTFQEVVSNYSWGPSRKDAMEHLHNSARKVADLHLHSVAAADEVLPNEAQVNFGPSVDILLAELIRLAKDPQSGARQSRPVR